MHCITSDLDFDKRVTIGNGKVVHAARDFHVRPRVMRSYVTIYGDGPPTPDVVAPAMDVLATACSSASEFKHRERMVLLENIVEVPHNSEITCKHCLRELGMNEKSRTPLRFVLVEKESGYFFKKQSWRTSWVRELTEATLYAVEGVARSYGEKAFYEHRSSKKRISYTEYRQLDSSSKQEYVLKKEFNDKLFEVKKVKMEIVD